MIIETFFQDIRIGLRVLLKEKSFCALAVFVLALGICAVTTQFSVVNGVLLRGFAFPKASELVDLQLADPTDFTPNNFNSRVTTADFIELKEQQKSYSALIAYLNGSTVNLTYRGNPQRLQGGYVTWDFFRVLGVAPAIGRDFAPEDDRPGVDKTIILSDKIWQRDFGGNPAVIGQAVRVNGRSGTVIGVMPPKFAFPANEELWIPVNTEFPPKPRNDRSISTVSVIGRLKPGVSIEQANAELMGIAQRFSKAYVENKQFSLGYVRPLIASFTGPIGGLLYLMLAFCVAVLLIACGNVMNMQFARATLRAKELAIRSSLGASRSRLVRQMLTESLLLAALGAIIGISLSSWTIEWVDQAVHAGNNPIPAWMTFRLDPPVLAFVVAITVLSAVVSGLLPALMASRANAADVLKESGRGNTGRSIAVVTKGLVVVQILFTSVLLIAALLQVQSIQRQQHIDYGYNTSGILSARMGLMAGDYPTNESRVLFFEKLLRQVRANPALESVALTNRFQMVFSGNGPIELEGKQYKDDKDRPQANFENVSDGYFATIGQRLLQGRDFTMDDNDVKLPVAIVNTTFARKFFGNESPLGRRFRTTSSNGAVTDPWRTIIGVVSDVRMTGPFNNNRLDNTGYYVPISGFVYGDGKPVINGLQFATILVKLRGDAMPESFATSLRRAVNEVDPNLPLYFVATPKTNLDAFIAQNYVLVLMFGVFGAVAVILASAGLYGVTAFSVNQRTQEFGIRMALGADSRLILKMVIRQGALQLVLGLGLGLLVALGLSYLMADGIQNFLFGISPRDPLTYIAVIALLALVSFLATFIPARRATKVDPMAALRAE